MTQESVGSASSHGLTEGPEQMIPGDETVQTLGPETDSMEVEQAHQPVYMRQIERIHADAQRPSMYIFRGGNDLQPPVCTAQPPRVSVQRQAQRQPEAPRAITPHNSQPPIASPPPAESTSETPQRRNRRRWIPVAIAAALLVPAFGIKAHDVLQGDPTASTTDPTLSTTTTLPSPHVRPHKHPSQQPNSSAPAIITELPTAAPTQATPTPAPSTEIVPTVPPPVVPTTPVPPETLTIGPTPLKMATYNVHHIGNDTHDEWMGRMHKLVNVSYGLPEGTPPGANPDKDKMIDVLMFQEMRPDQVEAFAQLTEGVYDFYPNPAKAGESYSPNIVAWRVDTWHKVGDSGVGFQYFGGSDMLAPVVALENKETHELVRASSGHNPADTQDHGMHNEDLRNDNNNKYKRAFARIIRGEDGKVRATVFGIDGNERYSIDPNDTQNEPEDNDWTKLIGCVLAGPDGPFDVDAYAASLGMTKQALCAKRNATSTGPNYVDHLFSAGIEYSWFKVVPASVAGSDHEVLIEEGVVPAHVELASYVNNLKQLAGARN